MQRRVHVTMINRAREAGGWGAARGHPSETQSFPISRAWNLKNVAKKGERKNEERLRRRADPVNYCATRSREFNRTRGVAPRRTARKNISSGCGVRRCCHPIPPLTPFPLISPLVARLRLATRSTRFPLAFHSHARGEKFERWILRTIANTRNKGSRDGTSVTREFVKFYVADAASGVNGGLATDIALPSVNSLKGERVGRVP